MLISFGCPVSGAWAQPETLTSIARQAEELGYHGLWAFQRLLAGRDQDLAPSYQSVLDPIVALTWAGAATSRIRLGVSVINLPYLSPAYLAKQVSSLDRLTGGRFDLGLGTGWSEPEFVATNADPRPRGRRTEEYLAVLRTLFTGEETAFEGEFYRVPPSRMLPRPVQPGGPPILLGGTAEVALRRAGRIAAGWVSSSRASPAEVERGARIVRQAAAETGKNPDDVRVVVRAAVDSGTESWDQIRTRARQYADAGATELFYEPNWDPRIGGPDADPDAAATLGSEMLVNLAPV
ncbi:TIGR03619 family F420-dependent LLM class oxidoreductase [Actinoplanes palleronii]|uniref:LLM class F420-dependent oxidoreductase n=1 Tax=Actinoplanes palleronii TaxID=113570 RepID=A0ABQ4BFF3_9ACTN|nr:TIGR03619 family F420-dependent LLM class oxidoreductase [Actinoplanes palleronii]GIE69377.1 LLM class F420-dependent oxidoreductase [Actinoplanes palleronii]